MSRENRNKSDKITGRIKIAYRVSGGAFIETLVFDDLSDAYNDFFRRIKLTRPLSESIIMIERIEHIDDLVLKEKLIHRVVLQ